MDAFDKYFDLFKKLYSLKGEKIQFNTKFGLYEGYIDYFLPSNRAVSFKNVYALPDKEYAGNLRFLLEDFISYKPVERDEIEKYEKWDYVSQILENTAFGVTKYKITDVFDDLQSVVSENDRVDEIEEDEFVLELPDGFEGKLPRESVIIDKVDYAFESAVYKISQESVIGVSFAGPRISRIGELTWLTVSIPECIYLFDIHLLGNSAFNEGLRDVLQNKQIQKVIHDCRKPSDCLYHLFGTKLENVFDTQVADYIVNTQRYNGKIPFKYVSSLDCCLVNHLDVPQDSLINRKEYYSYQSELTFFHVRPLCNEYRKVLIKDVIYLKLLKEKLTECMLSLFQKTVDIHLSSLTDFTGPQNLLEPHNPKEISPAVLIHGVETVRYVEKFESQPIPLICKFRDAENRIITDCKKSPKREKKQACHLVNNDINEKAQENVELSKEGAKTNTLLNQKNLQPSMNENNAAFDTFNVNYRSRRHIDNVYRKLVNNLHRPTMSQNYINVKPCTGISKISIKNYQKTLGSNQGSPCNNHCDQSSINNVSEIASGIETVSISHSGETLSKFPEAVKDNSANLVASNHKICFIPAGMSY